ncbi:hypothetical protein ACS0TY_031800 [Phlomoides rotata]
MPDLDRTGHDVASRLSLNQGSLKHYGINSDVDGLILMADVILYGSSQEEQRFPPLLTRAMSFGIPVLAPDYLVIRKYLLSHGGPKYTLLWIICNEAYVLLFTYDTNVLMVYC